MPTPNQLPERLRLDDYGRFRSADDGSLLRMIGYGEHGDLKQAICDRYNSHAALIRERNELKRQVRIQQESLERKNRELDSMHYVWCDGGCETGVHRWDKSEVTEEIVALAEKNVQRLRVWFNNYKHRKSLTHYDPKS